MEDRIAREGTLVRCDRNPVEAQTDIECANAHRAAIEIAYRAERERSAELERESERRMAAMRQQLAESERIAREALLEAERQEEAAYEMSWSAQGGAPAEGAAAGNVSGAPEQTADDDLNLIERPASVGGDESPAAPAPQ